MINKTYYQIEGHDGRWLHVDTTISELGHIMAKFHNAEKGVWMNVSMGLLEDALKLPWRQSQVQEDQPTKFLQSVEEVHVNGRIYYLDPNGQYYRLVEMDEDFDFVDPDDAEFAYVYVEDPYAEEEDAD